MSWEILFASLIGGGLIAGLVELIKLYMTRSKTQTEIKVMKSEASENITEAAQVAMGVVMQALNFKKLEMEELQASFKELQARQKLNDGLIRELQEHREERARQIDELTENNEALLSQVAALRAQITKDTSETRSLREELKIYKAEVKKYFSDLIQFLQSRGIEDYPLPPDNLLDTDPNIKRRK